MNCPRKRQNYSRDMKPTWTWIPIRMLKRLSVVTLLVPCLLITLLYFMVTRSNFGLIINKEYDIQHDWVDAFLVWNPKCHMPSENPTDSSIKQFIHQEEFESCSDGPLLSSIEKDATGSFFLVINKEAAKNYKEFVCCWAPIRRSVPEDPPSGNWDTEIELETCQDFENRVRLPEDLETVMITCTNTSSNSMRSSDTLYENIHPILNPSKVQSRLTNPVPEPHETNQTQAKRKLSILVLGVDNVSHLNFQRSLPKTGRYLRKTGWRNLRGYNKMGENTFPNLMAILTGQNLTTVENKCPRDQAYGFDNCSFLWSKFRKAGYVTAYGEDGIVYSTFNYLKVGFVHPPTDYYLRPYMVATEKLLNGKKRFNDQYCTGPELVIDRVFDYALNFAKTFLGSPYFGFFWTNTVSHGDINGPSSMDDHFVEMFKKFESSGVTNDTLMVFLSDHGMRYGGIRDTYIGWYEERLPFMYLRVPEWMKEDPSVFQSLRINENRLTSPYDLYETFREILIRSGGSADASSGCPKCQSLFKPVPIERGCADAGVSPHWCTCTALKPTSTDDEMVKEGAAAFLRHVEESVKDYKDENGRRLCAQFQIGKIHKVHKIMGLQRFSNHSSTVEGYLYLIEVTPGEAKFEATITVNGKGNYSVSTEDITRINSYAESAQCLDNGLKQFCQCIERGEDTEW